MSGESSKYFSSVECKSSTGSNPDGYRVSDILKKIVLLIVNIWYRLYLYYYCNTNNLACRQTDIKKHHSARNGALKEEGGMSESPVSESGEFQLFGYQ